MLKYKSFILDDVYANTLTMDMSPDTSMQAGPNGEYFDYKVFDINFSIEELLNCSTRIEIRIIPQ